MRTCTVEGCTNRHYAKGLCNGHYLRVRIHGSTMPDEPIRTTATKATTLEQRLLAGLPDRPADGCWLWTRATNSHGYGKVCIDGKTISAHRAAYATWNGPLPSEKALLHTCDTPACCNPAHLLTGTHAENMADMVRKGRQQRGEASGKAVLTAADVLAIRADTRRRSVIAAEYGLSASHIGKIQRREKWAHI
jgi:hypothetical protein